MRSLSQAFCRKTSPRRGRGHQEAAPGEHLGVVGPAAHPDELFDAVVIRRDIRVADRPGDSPPVPLRGGKVQIGHAKTHSAPDVRLPTAPPDPREIEGPAFRGEVGLFFLVEEELRRRVSPPQTPIGLERQHVGPEFLAVEHVAGVEHQDLDALLREVVGGHPARSPAPNNDDIWHR
jgi:hypothetical protein